MISMTNLITLPAMCGLVKGLVASPRLVNVLLHAIALSAFSLGDRIAVCMNRAAQRGSSPMVERLWKETLLPALLRQSWAQRSS